MLSGTKCSRNIPALSQLSCHVERNEVQSKHLSLINIAETLRQAQGDNTPYPTWMPDQVRHDGI